MLWVPAGACPRAGGDGDDVLACGHFAEESAMVPLSSRASVSEARDPYSAVSRYCYGVWVPAGACPRADGDGDDVLMCCRPGRARARPGIHTPQFLNIAAAYGSPLEPVLAQAGTGTTC